MLSIIDNNKKFSNTDFTDNYGVFLILSPPGKPAQRLNDYQSLFRVSSGIES